MERVNISCPFCGKDDKIYLVKQKTSVKIKEQLVEYKEEIYKCESCGEEFEDGKLTSLNLLSARDAYRKKNNLLTSSQIAQIRKGFNLSQADFSLALGFGEVTITRYETKQIQDSTYDMILRMVQKSPFMLLQILEKNKNNFTEERYKIVEENIRNSIKQNLAQETEIEKMKNKYIVYNEPTKENGYTILDVNKLNNIIGIVLSKVNCMYKVQLMKTLWYIDYIYYEKSGKSATGLVYEHRKMGALPIGNNELLYLSAINIQEEYYSNGNMGYKISLNDKFELSKVSKELEEIIEMVVKKFKNKSAKEIIEYMHNEEAYLQTKENEIIPFSKDYKLKKF